MMFFNLHDRAEHAEILANYLPNGDVFGGKTDAATNLYKLLFGLAEQNRLIEEKLELTYDQYNIQTTEDFLTEWERALGIPDSCFSGTGDIASRQRDVNVKFLADETVTVQDFIDIAALYGIIITITNGLDDVFVFPLVFPLQFSDLRKARFTMIVSFTVDEPLEFPLVFPIPFGNDLIEVLKCLFRKLAPANVDVIYRQV